MTESPTASTGLPETGRTMRLPRSRGAVTGVLLVLLGAWAALAPFVAPYFHFGYTPHPRQSWHWTAARGWYEVLPGGLAVFAGLLLLVSTHASCRVRGLARRARWRLARGRADGLDRAAAGIHRPAERHHGPPLRGRDARVLPRRRRV